MRKRYIIRISGDADDPMSLNEMSDLLAPLKMKIIDDSVFPRMLLVEGESKNLLKLEDSLSDEYIISEENTYKVPTTRKSVRKK
jgi:hypothetical protein